MADRSWKDGFFVQIAVSGDLAHGTLLYALDAAGRVWRWNAHEERWQRMPVAVPE